LGYAAALGSVALVSTIIGIVVGRIAIANVSMLYLIAVLATAVLFGSGPAVAASIAAFLTFNFFFVAPVHTFTVADPAEWVSLLLFLLTAMITGQLAADQRRRAREAAQREREAVVLYDVVRLMGEPDLERALRAVAERVRQELRLTAVAIELPQEGRAGVVRTVVGEDSFTARLRRWTVERAGQEVPGVDAAVPRK
jgi:two-component system sensor histidine kinase KdpD